MLVIREKRIQKGMTQAELAKAVNVNQTAVSQWERNLTFPTLDKARLLAQTFQCSIDELFEGENLHETGA